MKEIMEKVLTKDTTKNDLESAVYDLVVSVCQNKIFAVMVQSFNQKKFFLECVLCNDR